MSAPWTILRMQYRMAPSIRKIVSAVSYDNCLTDAPEIVKRTLNLPPSIFEVFPSFHDSEVIVLSHKCLETKVDGNIIFSSEL
jgi:superfamily I DNA and/or RNA helicase